jgi:hypothetical protein
MSSEGVSLVRELEQAVRDEVRAAFVEEFEALGQAGRRAAEALDAVRRVASLRLALWVIVVVVCCSLIPLAMVRMALPTRAELIRLRSERDSLKLQVAQLSERGGRIDLRRCGPKERLCARVERAVPRYGADGDYYVLKGY